MLASARSNGRRAFTKMEISTGSKKRATRSNRNYLEPQFFPRLEIKSKDRSKIGRVENHHSGSPLGLALR